MSYKVKNITRYLAYIIELIIFAVLQQVPGALPLIFGVKPILILSMVITIALFEDVFTSLAFGVIGGLLMDSLSGGIFGFYAVILAIVCFFLGVVSNNFIKTNFYTALLTGGISVVLVIFTDWFLLFLLKGSEYPGYAFFVHYLPRTIYTFIFIPVGYAVNRAFALVLQPEEK